MDTEKQELVTLAPATGETIGRIIQAYLNDDVCLSEQDKQVQARLVAADELLKDYHYHSNEKRAEALRDKFGISIRTARNDLKQAAELFNHLDAVDVRLGARIVLDQLDRLLEICLETKPKGFIKEATNIIKQKIEVYANLSKGAQIDPRLLQQNQFFFGTGTDTARLLNLDQGLTRADILNMLRQYNVSRADTEKILNEAHIEDAEILSEYPADAGAAD